MPLVFSPIGFAAELVGRTPRSGCPLGLDALVPQPVQWRQHLAGHERADGGVGRGSGVRPTILLRRKMSGIRSATHPTYTSSNSIFFAAASSLLMRKLRIWPLRGPSPLGPLPPWPPFQRACSMLVKEDRSTLSCLKFSSSLGASALNRHVAWTPSPSSTLAREPETSVMRPVTTSPSLRSAIYSSRPVGISCLMPRRRRRFSTSSSSTCALTTCPVCSTSCG